MAPHTISERPKSTGAIVHAPDTPLYGGGAKVADGSTLPKVMAFLHQKDDRNKKEKKVLKRRSCGSLEGKAPRRLEDMGEIERILNDTTRDSFLWSECERELREKYGLEIEAPCPSDLLLPFHHEEEDHLDNTAGEELYSSNAVGCGGGVVVRHKLGEVVRRYAQLVHVGAFVRHVVAKARKPKRCRALRATKLAPATGLKAGIRQPLPGCLTVIPESGEVTVGEALLTHPQSLEEELLLSPSSSQRLGLDLGDGEFEKRRKRLSALSSSKRSSGFFSSEFGKRRSLICTKDFKNKGKFVLKESSANTNKGKERKSSRNSLLFRDSSKGGLLKENKAVALREKTSAACKTMWERCSSVAEEGASTSWLLVLYSPEFAPKNSANKR